MESILPQRRGQAIWQVISVGLLMRLGLIMN